MSKLRRGISVDAHTQRGREAIAGSRYRSLRTQPTRNLSTLRRWRCRLPVPCAVLYICINSPTVLCPSIVECAV